MVCESWNIASDAGSMASLSVRVLFILIFSLGYAIWTRDVKLSYLQGGQLALKIYARPPMEIMECFLGYLLWKFTPVYGLREAWSHWEFLLHGHIRQNLVLDVDANISLLSIQTSLKAQKKWRNS